MAESLNAKHQVDEDKNGVRVARLIKLAIVFVVLLIVLAAVGVLTHGKSVEVQLFGAIFCIILIIVEMILGVILLIYGPRELNRFGKELGELVKEVELDINQCSFDGAKKKLVTSEAYGGKTYEMEVLDQTVCQQKDPAEYYLAYVEIKKKNKVKLYVSSEAITNEEAQKIFNTERKDMRLNLYTPDRETAYQLTQSADLEERPIEHTDLQESPLKVKHFHHAAYVADEQYPVQIFYGNSEQ